MGGRSAISDKSIRERHTEIAREIAHVLSRHGLSGVECLHVLSIVQNAVNQALSEERRKAKEDELNEREQRVHQGASI